MSIDLNWETVTGGPDGLELAHKIRDFIHTKFQSVPLPRFIKSVTVHDFEFGTIPPELELKDITDPLPDFYEENSDVDDSESDGDGNDENDSDAQVPEGLKAAADRRRRFGAGTSHLPPHLSIPGTSTRSTTQLNDLGSPFLGVSTPGIPGGTSNLNLNYFHSQFANGLSGTQTPLAAVASAQHLNNAWPEPTQQQARHGGGFEPSQRGHSRNPSQSSISIMDFNPSASSGIPSSLGVSGPLPPHPTLREKSSVSTLAPTSAGTSRPPTRDAAVLVGSAIAEDDGEAADGHEDEETQRRFRERRIEDMQAVFHIKYAGDVKLLLTADILLDYPMQSFVGIPLRLSITGLTFDGVGVLAKIRKRVHFCFLSPEDAHLAVGGEENLEQTGTEQTRGPGLEPSSGRKMGSLLQEIRVESEIGQRESGKQSLKNLGKVERFVLEQVRRIFEEEFVYPSFWTFLV
ncbi:hypothetical protein QBC34DRAFT_415561 [Podospora aff. communis PSN243]|uniref:Mitochondrial distribution and morphology protein 12 n=1 Tax=Podospora aff. communis PSN243 TaxID=3040156 RepID=A0AAV9G7G7_9PEZI|nr:hypothetical protein QBC34DRAFT_415561 [Podospora aff. communis PSN243]